MAHAVAEIAVKLVEHVTPAAAAELSSELTSAREKKIMFACRIDKGK